MKPTPIADYFFALTTAVLEHTRLLIACHGQRVPIPSEMARASRKRVLYRFLGLQPPKRDIIDE